MLNLFYKQPNETVTHAISYVAALPIDASAITSATLSAIDMVTGSTVTSTVLASSTAEISGMKALFTARAGTDGRDYKITVRATLNNDDIIEDDIVMRVRSV